MALALLGACGGATDDASDELNASELNTKTVDIAAGASNHLSFHVAAADAETFTIDCGTPADPDEVGAVLAVDAPDLGTKASDPPRAGYWSWTGTAGAGDHAITIANRGASTAHCAVRVTKPKSSSCGAWTSHHSPNTHHDHFRVGSDTSSDWESFPASGNHWGSWAKWNTVYPKPIRKGFLLHNLEHGGVVLSYKCASSKASAACTDAENALVDLANQAGLSRVIITPDPTQPETYAVRAWRWAYSSSCLDVASASAFAREHQRHGREDIDADPPIPFDPTTTQVPCQDLMAAPDSCTN